MNKLIVPHTVIQQTMHLMRDGGSRNCETMVLWLGTANVVSEVYRPEQQVAEDRFYIDPSAMRTLMQRLSVGRPPRPLILAQVHSHPEKAFHSRADDALAITRREGVLSLVLPYFGMRMSDDDFLAQAVTFQLTGGDRWLEVQTDQHVQISK